MNTAQFNTLDKLIARLRLAQVIRYVAVNDVVLDFGCGVQHYLLSQAKGKIKYGYGIDSDIKDTRTDNITLLNHRYNTNLPFDSNFFDKIFLLAVLEHIEMDKVKILLAELSRILKFDGKIILTTPTPKGQKVLEFLAFKLKVISFEEIADHKHYYSRGEVCDLATAVDLKVVESKFFQFGLNSLYVIAKAARV